MKKLACFLSIVLFSTTTSLKAQCLQIEGILVDACNSSGAFSEPYNEMVRFKTGTTSLPIGQLSIAGKGNTGSFSLNKWPNASQAWHGLVQNANTASKVTAINASIQACGHVKEPPAGVIPANSEVIMVCSQYMNPTSNSFANLNDTIYMVFQDTVSSSTQGHFANYNATPGFRSLVLIDNAAGCSDTVKYDVSLLPLHTDGDAVEYDAAGNPTYVNNGCQAPYIPLSIDAGPDQTICFNDSITMTATPGGQYSSIGWSVANSSYGSFTSSTALTTTFVPSGSAVSPVKIYVTLFTVCGGSVKDSALVTLNPGPAPVVTGSSNTHAVCIGSNFVLSVNPQSNTTYSWNPGAATGTSFTVSPSSQTVYTVFATNGCVTNSATYTLNVNSLPVLSVLNDTICRGATDTLTASGAASYTWSTSANTATTTVSPISTTQYSVSGTDGNGCTGSTSAEVYVYSLPTLSVTAQPVCPGGTTTLTASGASTYTWNTLQTGASISVVLPQSTTYTVVGTDAHACSNFTTYTATTYSLPAVSVSNASVCPSSTVALTANGAQTYTWSPATTLSASTGVSVVASPTTQTVYTISGTDGATGCVGSSTFTVSISASPNVSINPVSACPGASATLTATGANTYTWSTSQTGANINVTASATSYSVVGANAAGCLDTAYASITLLSGPTPQNITGFPVICAGQTDLLTVVPGGVYTYTWTGPSGNLGNSNTAVATQSGTYTVVAANGCGNVTATFSVLVSAPSASITPSATQGTAPATFTFTNSSNGTGLSNYWNFANGDSSNQLSPSETFTTGGTYNVELWVVDTYGCVDSASVTVYVTDSVAIVIPNVFSPNGDGINDVFSVKGMGITSFNCKIYDRWGISLYEWNSINGGWDGKSASNGHPASDGTYYFLISYTTASNKTTTKPGFLQLVR